MDSSQTEVDSCKNWQNEQETQTNDFLVDFFPTKTHLLWGLRAKPPVACYFENVFENSMTMPQNKYFDHLSKTEFDWN